MTSRPMLAGPTVHLGTLGPFRALSPMQLAMVALETEEVVFDRESWISPRDTEQKAMHMIVDGHVRVFTDDGAVVVGPGGMVGFPDLFVPGARSLGAIADSEVVALRLETDALRDVCERSFPVLASLLAVLAERAAGDVDACERVIQAADGPAAPFPTVAQGRVLRMLALQRAPALPSESMDALAELAGRIEALEVREGQPLWRAGDIAERFWVIGSGAVRRTRGARVSLLGPSAVPGFPETLAGIPFEGSAEVAQSGFLLAVDVDPFMDILEDHFELAFAVLGWMARHLGSESSY